MSFRKRTGKQFHCLEFNFRDWIVLRSVQNSTFFTRLKNYRAVLNYCKRLNYVSLKSLIISFNSSSGPKLINIYILLSALLHSIPSRNKVYTFLQLAVFIEQKYHPKFICKDLFLKQQYNFPLYKCTDSTISLVNGFQVTCPLCC